MSIHSSSAPADAVNLLRELYSPRDVEHVLSVSHATLYRLISSNRLDARKIDGKTVITAASIRRFITDLPRVGEEAASRRPVAASAPLAERRKGAADAGSGA